MPKQRVIATAPGKINVYFKVGPPREDGYHEVASLYVAVSLLEEIDASLREDGELQLSLEPGSPVVSDPNAQACRLARSTAEVIKPWASMRTRTSSFSRMKPS